MVVLLIRSDKDNFFIIFLQQYVQWLVQHSLYGVFIIRKHTRN
jgi:hypothetical protein